VDFLGAELGELNAVRSMNYMNYGFVLWAVVFSLCPERIKFLFSWKVTIET
jgi:hypothetical protein